MRLALLFLCVAACGDGPGPLILPPGSPYDAGQDAGTDAGTPDGHTETPDAGQQEPEDAGTPEPTFAVTLRWGYRVPGFCRASGAMSDQTRTCDSTRSLSQARLSAMAAHYASCGTTVAAGTALIDCSNNCTDMGYFCAASGTGVVVYVCQPVDYVPTLNVCEWFPPP